jgi:hypothetical protein
MKAYGRVLTVRRREGIRRGRARVRDGSERVRGEEGQERGDGEHLG